ncbi:unnamed protein product [Closterium sp. Yama58-4]|nr:unnamed protein product [Closterium sp. Yama58-4]
MHGRRLPPALRSPRARQSRHVLTAAAPLFPLVLLALASFGGFGSVQVGATPFSVYDSYQPPCPFLPDPPPQGWKRWSDPATWTNGGGSVIPGVKATGGEWANVTIPCGTAVLLDVPLVSLSTLVVKGWLRWKQPSSSFKAASQSAPLQRPLADSPSSPSSPPPLAPTTCSPTLLQPTLCLPLSLHCTKPGSSTRQLSQPSRCKQPSSSFKAASQWAPLQRPSLPFSVHAHPFPSPTPPNRVLDSPSLPTVEVQAAFIIVQGRLSVGSTATPFSRLAIFTLLPSPSRVEYTLTDLAPAEPLYQRNLGHKAFIVVGGAVDLHGMPGSSSAPAWVRLARTVAPGDKFVVVDGDVTQWPVGGTVAVASTSANMNEAETGVITYVAPMPSGGGFYVGLAKPLRFRHEGTLQGTPDGVGGTVDIRGEVALLDRNIIIRGLKEKAPYDTDGGHFMVFMTKTPQFIEGVQFLGLGNQGTLGRYPLHFHICGDTNQANVVRKNVIAASNQRCVVIHATSNATIEENVAYETKGHCFITEEGSEFNNVFKRNLGINIRGVRKVIPPETSDRLDRQTDNQATTFWMASPRNDLIGNVAAGCDNTGFWYEMLARMRGASKRLDLGDTPMPFFDSFGRFDSNVAHSCKAGVRMYPHGNRPPKEAVFTNLLVYQSRLGILFHRARDTTVRNSAFVDVAVGIGSDVNVDIKVQNSRFVGRTQACTSPAKAASGGAVSTKALSAASAASAADDTASTSVGASIFPNQPSASAAAAAVQEESVSSQLLRSYLNPGSLLTATAASTNEDVFTQGSSIRGSMSVTTTNAAAATATITATTTTADAYNLFTIQNLPTESTSPTLDPSTQGTPSNPPTDGYPTPIATNPSSNSPTVSDSSETPLDPSSDPAFAKELSFWQDEEVASIFSSLSRASLPRLPKATLSRIAQLRNRLGLSRFGHRLGEGLGNRLGKWLRGSAGGGNQSSVELNSVASVRAAVVSFRFGTFESPVGIALSQQHWMDPAGSVKITGCSFTQYATCNPASPAIVAQATVFGGFWDTSTATQGLKFDATTSRVYLQQEANPTKSTSLVSNFIAVRDTDGTLIGGSGGFAIVPYLAKPPASVPAKQNKAGKKPAGPLTGCQYRDLSVGFTCPGTCFHSFSATFYEATGAAAVKGSSQRPYSYLVITRDEDGAQFTAYGFQNDPIPVIPAKTSVRRWISATLEAGFTYSVRVVAPPSNPAFYPDRIAVQLRDVGGCEGRVRVLFEPKDSGTNWVATYSPPTRCASTVLAPSTTYQSYLCSNSRRFLALDFGAPEQSYQMLGLARAASCSSTTC